MKNKVLSTAINAILLVFFLQNLNAQETKPEFKPSGKVWGYLFGDYFYKVDGDTSVTGGEGEFSKVSKDYNAFTVRRAYLGYDYNISEKFSAQFLLEGNDGVTTKQDSRTVFIKSAYVEWKNLVPCASLFIGQSATPSWPILTEKIWDYRSVEKTIADFRKLGKSNDLGIRVSGNIDTAGKFGYDLMVGNGTADKKESNKYKKVYGSFWTKLLNKKIIIEAYADHEKLSDVQSITTLKGFIAYDSKVITAGVEAVRQVQSKVVGDTANKAPMGIAVFARGTIKKDKLKAFARFDLYNPNTEITDAGYMEDFISFGFDYTPHKNVHIMPNIWVNTYSDKSSAKLERKADLVPRVTFYYVFK